VLRGSVGRGVLRHAWQLGTTVVSLDGSVLLSEKVSCFGNVIPGKSPRGRHLA
jgi:hypothetical protein